MWGRVGGSCGAEADTDARGGNTHACACNATNGYVGEACASCSANYRYDASTGVQLQGVGYFYEKAVVTDAQWHAANCHCGVDADNPCTEAECR